MNKLPMEAMRSICDEFVEWQGENGIILKEKCPYFSDDYKPLFRYMEVPFMGRALYKFYDLTKEEKYKQTADKYMLFYINLICDLITSEKIAYKFGMALEAAALYAKYNPLKSIEMKVYIRLFADWLRQLKDDKLGSYFRCGYLPGTKGIKLATDVGFSDDLCHVGRGLVRAYELLGDTDLLYDIKQLSIYFVTDQKADTQDGIWNPALGTWSLGPWPDKNFEHMSDTAANEAGWVYSAYGVSEFLLDATYHIEQGKHADNLKKKCLLSIKWIYENCYFDDGSVGMTGKDDKWVGLTAAAIMGILKLYEHNTLSSEDLDYFKPFLEGSWKFLLNNTGNNMPEAGYIEVTGNTNPIPGDNVAWLLSWIVECLAEQPIIDSILKS
ncbi:MAG: hypothetical protein EWM47_10140 [Anaerolineaceae bacterium]|nr:MAG: hypothetical protein EWM47_10140 [Anaerolineaceae bacterium]